MQVSVESTKDLERRLTVELPREGLVQKVNERLETLKGQVSVEGFRPGKVPLDVVRNKYGAQIQQEVFSEAINDSLQQALGQEQLEPVDKPVVEIDEASPDSVFRYFARFEVMPQVDIQPVEQIKVVRPIVEITESDVDKMVENMRTQRMLWKPAGRPAQAGDRVTVDYSGTVDGQGFPGAVAQGLPVVIGGGGLIPGFEDQLLGVTEAGSTNVEVTIPESFPAPEFRGKTAVFKVKVHQVEEPQLPELNDIFFRSFGVREGGLAAFREQVKHTMGMELKQKILGTIKTAMLNQLLEIHTVVVPDSLIQRETERMKSMAEENQEAGSMTENDLVAQARYRVSCGIILTALAKKLGISASSELVRKKIESLAESYENPDEVVAWYYSSQEQLASVESMVTEELLVDYVLEHGQVSDQPTSLADMMNS
jgi:trigger factor